jgi:hypothetical protein
VGTAVTAARVAWERRLDPTYRRLADGYRLPDGSRRIYCHHIRKTAGTSLHSAFLALGGEDPLEVKRRMERSVLRRTISGTYTFVAHRQAQFPAGQYFYAWSHLPAHRVELPPQTFTVTVLRDPVRRVVSLFRYLQAGDEPDMAFAVTEGEREMATDGFEAFLDRLPRRELLRQLFTFSRHLDVAEAAAGVEACSYVFMTDAYDTGLAGLAGRLDLPLASRRDRVSRGSGPAPEERAHLERLREMLEPEYALLERVGLHRP